jgi:urea transport system ATP-binding protein
LDLGLAPKGGAGKIPDYIFELFPMLPKFSKRKGGDLSGGQQQQLAIARALAAEPKILILDEPTEGIQPSIIKDIGAAIRKISSRGITVLMVEQYLDFVMGISDNLHVMEKGRIILSGAVKDLDSQKVQKILTN